MKTNQKTKKSDLPDNPQDLSVLKLHSSGEGIANWKDRSIRIRNTLPGEEVTATIVSYRQHTKEAFAELLSIQKKSTDRVIPFCEHFTYCGGCDLQHLSYEGQLREKRNILENLLQKYSEFSQTKLDDCQASFNPFFYRYLAKWVVSCQEGKIVLGAYARRSHRVVSTKGCPVHRPPLEKLAKILIEELSKEAKILIGNKGVRYFLARESVSTGNIILTVISYPDHSIVSRLKKFVLQVVKRFPLLGVVHHTNALSNTALFDRNGTDTLLWGTENLQETFDDVSVSISPKAFLQINAPQAEMLRKKSLELAQVQPEEIVIDLYSGVGALSFTLARQAKEVFAIEQSKDAVKSAKEAAEGINNLRILQGDASEEIEKLQYADVVFLNPPRSGADVRVLQNLSRLKPSRILYTSCSSKTFIRDALILYKATYQLKQIIPFDLFPQTAHIEILGFFTRKS